MLSNSFSKIYNEDPELGRVLSKIQDLLSLRKVGDQVEKEIFKGLKEPESMISSALSIISNSGLVKIEELVECPNLDCDYQTEYGNSLVCDDCGLSLNQENLEKKTVLSILKKIEITSNQTSPDKSYFNKQFAEQMTGEILHGRREEDWVHLFKRPAHSQTTYLIKDDDDLLELKSEFFQPEFGSHRKCFSYKYQVKNKGIFVQQNLNITAGNNNTFGDVSQNATVNSDKLIQESFKSLVLAISENAKQNQMQDQEIWTLLNQSLSLQQDQKGILSVLNKFVAYAANYATVFGPFMPQILTLIEAVPKT